MAPRRWPSSFGQVLAAECRNGIAGIHDGDHFARFAFRGTSATAPVIPEASQTEHILGLQRLPSGPLSPTEGQSASVLPCASTAACEAPLSEWAAWHALGKSPATLSPGRTNNPCSASPMPVARANLACSSYSFGGVGMPNEKFGCFASRPVLSICETAQEPALTEGAGTSSSGLTLSGSMSEWSSPRSVKGHQLAHIIGPAGALVGTAVQGPEEKGHCDDQSVLRLLVDADNSLSQSAGIHASECRAGVSVSQPAAGHRLLPWQQSHCAGMDATADEHGSSRSVQPWLAPLRSSHHFQRSYRSSEPTPPDADVLLWRVVPEEENKPPISENAKCKTKQRVPGDREETGKSTDCAAVSTEVAVGTEVELKAEHGFRIEIAGPDLLRLVPSAPGVCCEATLTRLDGWPDLKRVPGGEVAWTFPMEAFASVAYRLMGKKQNDSPLPSWVTRMWAAAAVLIDSQVPNAGTPCRYQEETPAEVREATGEMLPYQAAAVRFGIQRSGRLLCGDEMGLGKTLTALALAFEYQQEWPVLIICPPSLRHQWRSQILHWLRHVLQPDDVQIIMHGKNEISDASRFVIVPYSLLHHDKFQCRSNGIGFEVVICDESHYIKEEKAIRTQAALPLLQRARRAILLSGTPSLNHAAELYTQTKAVLGDPFVAFKTFADRYANRKVFGFGRFRCEKFTGVRRAEELGVLLQHVMIRRKKEDVLTQLPQKRRQRVVVTASNTTALRNANQLLDGLDEAELGLSDILPEQDVRDVFKLVCEAKLKSTQDYVSYLLDGLQSKILFFAHHRVMLDAIEQTLRSRKVRFIRIDGQVPQQRRPQLINSFQEDSGVTCAVLSITACSEGLNLTAASTVVFCELYWVPGVMEQCEARAHRMGQQTMVNIHYIVVEGSVDEKAFACLSRKKAATSVILDGEVHSFKPDKTVTAQPPDRAPASREEQLLELEALHTLRREERQAQRTADAEQRETERVRKRAAKRAELLSSRAAKADARAELQAKQKVAMLRQAEAKQALQQQAKAGKASRRVAEKELRAAERAIQRQAQAQINGVRKHLVRTLNRLHSDEASGAAESECGVEGLGVSDEQENAATRAPDNKRRRLRSQQTGARVVSPSVSSSAAPGAQPRWQRLPVTTAEEIKAEARVTSAAPAAVLASETSALTVKPSTHAVEEPLPSESLNAKPVLPFLNSGRRRVHGKCRQTQAEPSAPD